MPMHPSTTARSSEGGALICANAMNAAGCVPRFDLADGRDRASNVRHAVRTSHVAVWRV